LEVGDFLFLGDHILSATTPHQSPKSDGGAGLQIYLDSLGKVSQLPAKLGLPGHEDTIYSVKARAEEIERFHYQRLEEVVELCQREKNLAQLTREYYEKHPESIENTYAEAVNEDYNRALALEEIKAHVEYLLENNRMIITGIKDGVVRYQSRR
jgi:glyoxylase-like metal-dependent hydrolase (beta-lactamase superfamily II)